MAMFFIVKVFCLCRCYSVIETFIGAIITRLLSQYDVFFRQINTSNCSRKRWFFVFLFNLNYRSFVYMHDRHLDQRKQKIYTLVYFKVADKKIITCILFWNDWPKAMWATADNKTIIISSEVFVLFDILIWRERSMCVWCFFFKKNCCTYDGPNRYLIKTLSFTWLGSSV